MALTFTCLTEPHYMSEDPNKIPLPDNVGHFEQSGEVHGRVGLGDEEWLVKGYGVRDKSWGPREWSFGATGSKQSDNQGADPHINWFSINFGSNISLGGSVFKRQSYGWCSFGCWLHRNGKLEALQNVVIKSEYQNDSILHKSIELHATTDSGETIQITGQIENMCPTKVPIKDGAVIINEGLARYKGGA